MIEVEARGDLEFAIRQLKKKLQIDGIKRELKRREYYEKPSVKNGVKLLKLFVSSANLTGCGVASFRCMPSCRFFSNRQDYPPHRRCF